MYDVRCTMYDLCTIGFMYDVRDLCTFIPSYILRTLYIFPSYISAA